MTFYVASGWGNRAAARRLAGRLEARGWIWSYDWTRHEEKDLRGPVAQRSVAVAEARGIAASDLVIVLLPGGRGTHAEMGIALGLGIPIMICAGRLEDLFGGEGRPCPFYAMVGVRRIVEPDSDRLVDRIVRLRGGRRRIAA